MPLPARGLLPGRRGGSLRSGLAAVLAGARWENPAQATVTCAECGDRRTFVGSHWEVTVGAEVWRKTRYFLPPNAFVIHALRIAWFQRGIGKSGRAPRDQEPSDAAH